MTLINVLKKGLTSGGHACAVESGVFLSAVTLGTGSEQDIPHGLAAVPAAVMVCLVGGPAAYVQPVITEGAHDGTNIKVTCTAGWSWRALAFA